MQIREAAHSVPGPGLCLDRGKAWHQEGKLNIGHPFITQILYMNRKNNVQAKYYCMCYNTVKKTISTSILKPKPFHISQK